MPPRTAPNNGSLGHKRIPLFYGAYKHPSFWYHKFKDIKEWSDFTYLIRGGRLVAEEYWRKLFK